jgi:hypothetical protein
MWELVNDAVLAAIQKLPAADRRLIEAAGKQSRKA